MPTEYFYPTNTNPTGKVGRKWNKPDCAVRAISIAFDIEWVEAFDILSESARRRFDVLNSDETIKDVLLQHGAIYTSYKAEKGKKRMTTKDFAISHKNGRYVLKIANHVCAVVDGKIRDTWNCGDCCVYASFEIKK